MTGRGRGDETDEASAIVRVARRGLTYGEDGIYVVVALLLTAAALVVLIDAASSFLDLRSEPVGTVALSLLDSLLLVFIFVELLAAVKLTLARREIIAEPFLLVGIVASIKEIVVLSVETADVISGEKQVTTTVSVLALQIGVLGAVALALAVAAWLLRLKEREPEEA